MYNLEMKLLAECIFLPTALIVWKCDNDYLKYAKSDTFIVLKMSIELGIESYWWVLESL